MSKASQDGTNGVSIKGGVIINAVSNPCLSKRRISGCGSLGLGHTSTRTCRMTARTRNLILSAFGTLGPVGDPIQTLACPDSPTTSTNDSAEPHSSTLLAGVD